MPWSEEDVAKHNKRAARNPRLRHEWVEVANHSLAEYGDDAKAIQTANAAVRPRKPHYRWGQGKE